MVKSTAFIGMQVGDEGKGKMIVYFISLLEKKIRGVYSKILNDRMQGGGNAGHSAERDGKMYKLFQIPSGIIRDKVYSFLGKGMFLEPRNLRKEIKKLIDGGMNITPEKLGISSKAHITLDYHLNEDQFEYNLKEHKTTGSGIKQTARDKTNRTGIRFVEFLDGKLMEEILREKVFPKGSKIPLGGFKRFVESYDQEREFLKQFLALEHQVFKDPRFKYRVAESAQGMMLDMEDGQYPGVTSSCPGQPTHRPDTIVGVFKSYVSSVGIGDRPFASEMIESLQKKLRDAWDEYGTKTGKPRHLGWFDVPSGAYAAETAHIDYATLTCLDRLEEFAKIGEKIKVVTAYKTKDGVTHPEWTAQFDRRDFLRNVTPVYEEFETWDRTVEKDGKTLTPNALKYVKAIEEYINRKIVLVGTGANNKDIVVRKGAEKLLR